MGGGVKPPDGPRQQKNGQHPPPPTPSARPRGQLKLGFGANLAAATWRPPQPLPTVTPIAPTVAGVKPPGGPVPPLSDPCDPRAATAPVGSGFWHGAFWGCAAAPPSTQVCRFYLNHAKRWPSDPARPVDFLVKPPGGPEWPLKNLGPWGPPPVHRFACSFK